ncbi:hypothetical protein GY45DRAFT_1092851 [Cubamyces sp. BRFM 1775]|nr:hypothetical protein GY45DRAFT_1092851 [Cubamyces sp. BRFM 1775]
MQERRQSLVRMPALSQQYPSGTDSEDRSTLAVEGAGPSQVDSSLSIESLPSSVLSGIFMALRAPKAKNPDWIAILQVCRRWREVALATPRLWEDLVLDEGLSPGAVYLIFSRSEGRIRRLTLNGSEMEAFYLDMILPSLIQHRYRYEALVADAIQGGHHEPFYALLLKGLPNLQELVLNAPPDDMPSATFVPATAFTSLRSLSVSNSAILIAGVLLHLERLEVTNYGGPLKHDPRFLRGLLYTCPNLKGLVLNHSIPDLQNNLLRASNHLQSLIPLPPDLSWIRVRDDAPAVQDFLTQAIIAPSTCWTLTLDYAPPRGLTTLPGCTFDDLLRSSDIVADAIRDAGKAALHCDMHRCLVNLRGCVDPFAPALTWMLFLQNGGPEWYQRTSRCVLSMAMAGTLFSPARLRSVDFHFTTGSAALTPVDWQHLLRGLPCVSSFCIGGTQGVRTFLHALCEYANAPLPQDGAAPPPFLPRLFDLRLCFHDTYWVRAHRVRESVAYCVQRKMGFRNAALFLLRSSNFWSYWSALSAFYAVYLTRTVRRGRMCSVRNLLLYHMYVTF